jgi:zinc transport system substrate-binding protein
MQKTVHTYAPWLLLLISLAVITLVLWQRTRHVTEVNSPTAQLLVATSFYPQYYFASEIGGETAQVFSITPPGTEAHEYEPTARDIARIEDSQLLIINGAVEEWAAQITPQLTSTEVVQLNDSLITDPHTWLNPTMAQAEVDKIAQGYITINPTAESQYLERAEKLKLELAALDQEFRTGLAVCQRREFVTTHQAFDYIATEYELSQIPISGLSPEEEPSARRLVEITNQIKNNGTKYIFFEELVSPELALTLAQEAGIETLVLNPLESLSQEDLDMGETYFTVMRSNLANLRLALECQ